MPIPIDFTKVFSHSSSQGQITSYHRELEKWYDANFPGATGEDLDDNGEDQPSSTTSPSSSSGEGDEEVMP